MPKYTVSFDFHQFPWRIEAEDKDMAIDQAATKFERYLQTHGIRAVASTIWIEPSWHDTEMAKGSGVHAPWMRESQEEHE